jgi:hypothetical protein
MMSCTTDKSGRATKALWRFGGLLLAAIAVVSLIVDVLVAIWAWSFRLVLSTDLVVAGTLLSNTLATSDGALVLLDRQLGMASASLTTAELTTESAATTMAASQLSLQQASALLQHDILDTIAATFDGLRSAQVSAKGIDDLLATMAAIPFLRLRYQPTSPLNVTMGAVADSLDGLPAQTRKLATGLSATTDDVETTGLSLHALADALLQSRDGLRDAQREVVAPRAEVVRYRALIDPLPAQIPRIITYVTVLFAFFLV